MKKEYLEPLEENIENVFKVEEPLIILENGFGYRGVLLRDRMSGKIQCHKCGKWFLSLLGHVRRTHKEFESSKAYRYTYQLPLSLPLCSRKTSEMISKNSVNKKVWEKMKASGKQNGLGKRQIPRKERLYGKTNMAYKNIHGTCDDQIQKRFLIVADKLGRTPTANDLRDEDNSLRVTIDKRFGSLNNFKDKFGYDKNKSSKKIKEFFEESEIINVLRAFHKENKRLPKPKDFHKDVKDRKVGYGTITSKFGSFHRALSISGLI